MTNVHIVILGLLHRGPLHGYEVKHIIEDHMGDWTDIKFGSIYFALSKLKEQGNVEIVEETRTGSRPARKVYQITGQGRGEYLRLLRLMWTQGSRTLYSLDIALFFIESLPKDEVLTYIQERIDAGEKTLSYVGAHQNEQMSDSRVPRQAMYIFDHSKRHMQAELDWLKAVQEDLKRTD